VSKSAKPDYLAKVKQLNKEETERLLSRMGVKLDRRLEKRKITQEEALAKQLELEDEQLNEWRKMMHMLKEKEKAKEKEKEKEKAKDKAKEKKPKKQAKAKPEEKPKVAAKPKAQTKSAATSKAKTQAKA
jgi:hypothetical protein